MPFSRFRAVEAVGGPAWRKRKRALAGATRIQIKLSSSRARISGARAGCPRDRGKRPAACRSDNGEMSRDVRPAGVRRFQGVTVFDNGADRPSEFGDSTTRPTLWDEPSRHPDSTLESRRRQRARSKRSRAGGLWPAVLVVVGLGIAGVALLARFFNR